MAAPLVGLRVSPSGQRLAVEAEAIARCLGSGPVDERLTVRTTLRPDGSFAGLASRTYRISANESRVVRLAAAGRVLDGRSASGKMRIVVFRRRPGRRIVRCDTRVQSWEARSPPLSSGPAAPLTGTSYYGVTGQALRYVPFPFALRVSASGGRIDSAVYRVFRRCRGVLSSDMPNDSPPATIRPDGTFSVIQRYSQRFPDSIEYFTFALAGRFGTGGVSGTLRARSFVRDLATRRIIGRCDSGRLTWAAIP